MRAKTRANETTLVAGASFVARLGVLSVVAAVGASFSGTPRDQIVVLIGITTAVQVLLDPNSVCAFVVTRWSDDHRANNSLLTNGFAVEAVTGLIVFAAPVAVALLDSMPKSSVLAGASIGAVSAAEAFARFGRVRFQATKRFARFATVDLLLACGRFSIAAVTAISASVSWFSGANAVWAAVVVSGVAIFFAPDAWAFTRDSMKDFLSGVWPFMGGSMSSAVYSQGPLVLLGVLGSIHAAAEYTVATRTTQPIELVPASLAAVYLPRLTEAEDIRAVERRQLRSAIGLGVGIALAVAAASPLIPHIFGYGDSGVATLIAILAIGLPFKFVNYQLVAVAFATGKARQRFYISGSIAVLSIVLVSALATKGAIAVACVSVSTEITLTAALALLAVSGRVRRVRTA